MLPDPASDVLQKPTVISAPGKVILFGEHSVLYGRRSLAFSLGLRTELTICPNKNGVSINLPEINVQRSWSLASLISLFDNLKRREKPVCGEPRDPSEEEKNIYSTFLGINKKDFGKSENGLIAFLHLYTSILPRPIPFSIQVESQMPVGGGLGSSAAYGVCLAGTLLWISGQLNAVPSSLPVEGTIPLKILNLISDWAFSSEKILHGNASGIDNAICTYGGGVSFKAGKIERICTPPLTIMLVNTKTPRNTKSLVSGVKEKLKRHTSIIEPIFTSMGNVAESALSILNEMKANSVSCEALKYKFFLLCELVDTNQCLLDALGVSHPRLNEIISVAQCHGLHAKLTGAGGGGFALILLSPDTPQKTIDSCKKDLIEKGFEAWVTELGGPGLSFAPSTKTAKNFYTCEE